MRDWVPVMCAETGRPRRLAFFGHLPDPHRAWIIAPKPFIIPLPSCAITKHDDAVKHIAGRRESTMLRWTSTTVALLAAALTGGSSGTLVGGVPALAPNTIKLELRSRPDPAGALTGS